MRQSTLNFEHHHSRLAGWRSGVPGNPQSGGPHGQVFVRGVETGCTYPSLGALIRIEVDIMGALPLDSLLKGGKMLQLDRCLGLPAWTLLAVLPVAPGVLSVLSLSQAQPPVFAPTASTEPAHSLAHPAAPGQSPRSLSPSAQPPDVPAAPAQPPTPEVLGDSLYARRQYQAAIAAYAKAPQRTASIWNKMGVAYQMMYNLKNAARCYKESLQLDHRNPIALNNLGTVYDSLKEYKQAQRMYRRALKVSPQSPLILKNLGTNFLAQHKYSQGWDAYQKALALNPLIFAGSSGPTASNPASDQQRGAMNYYMALACTRAGYSDCALQYLRLAIDEGFITAKKLAAANDFASLRKNPAFQQLLADQKQKRNPPPQ